MSIQKCISIILSTTPFRESSLLLYLFTRQHGRIHALAKGVRKGDRRSAPIERGYLIEHTTYLKPHRDLHLATDCHILEHFPAIRNDLEKTAIRDVLFDVLLGAVKLTDPHPELFDYLSVFLKRLEESIFARGELLLHLSKAIFGLAGYLGVGMDFGVCSRCGKSFGEGERARLVIDAGAILCESCSSCAAKSSRLLPQGAVPFLSSFSDAASVAPPYLTDKESMEVLRIACEYCRHHLDIRRRLESLSFADQLFA